MCLPASRFGGLSDPEERRAAQGILDFWSTELVSLLGAGATDYLPALLAPFDPTRAVTRAADSSSPAESIGDKPHDLIRITAAARLSRDSAKQSGYLLWDKVSIEQASRFRDMDSDIADLVKASENAVRTRTVFRVAAALVGLLILVVVVFAMLLLGAERRRQQQVADQVEYSHLLDARRSSWLRQKLQLKNCRGRTFSC